MSEEVFQRYSAYYDLIYKDKDYSGEAEYVTRSLRTCSPDLKSILELGSGTGKHGRLLAEQGFEVFGIERSATMVAEAKKIAKGTALGSGSFDCVQGDIRSYSLNRTFDAAISLFHVISYQTRNQDVCEAFACAASHLKSGGIFFFDVWHGPAVLKERPSVRVKRLENDCIRLTRIAEPELDTNASTVAVNYTMLAESKADGGLVSFGESHLMRYFFPVEIELIAKQSGFEVIRTEEFLTASPASEQTWGVAYLLRKSN